MITYVNYKKKYYKFNIDDEKEFYEKTLFIINQICSNNLDYIPDATNLFYFLNFYINNQFDQDNTLIEAKLKFYQLFLKDDLLLKFLLYNEFTVFYKLKQIIKNENKIQNEILDKLK